MWCETMSSAERMGALMRGERPDRVPVIPFIFGHTALVCGQPLARAFDDAEESFRCQVLAAEMYGYDGGPLYAYASAGGWEFGGDVEFPAKKYSGATVVTRTPIQNEDDVYTLPVPEDITKAGALPIALGLARKQAEHGMPVTLQIGSPLTWAGSVIGEERMMVWLIKKPELVHIVLDKVSQFLIKVAEHYTKEFGAEKLMAFHGAATESNMLISPKQFETFVLPYLQRINSRVLDLGVTSFFIHICGEQNKNLKFWQQVPVTRQTVMSFGREVELATAMEMFPEQIIAGNVDPTIIQESRAEEVLRQAKECIEVAKYHKGGYILMAGCDVPPQAPPVNVFQMVKAAREFGRY
ncbi:MAG: uroporphyrinogen decarboxylase family protein [Actinobacteria bacterium]|nr:uroporphyrinogen decarboxylase family protein [Actinomycetota bacterium]